MRRHSKPCDILQFEVDVGVNKVVGKYVASPEKFAIFVERTKGLIERKGNQLELFLLLGRQVVKIFVQRIARVYIAMLRIGRLSIFLA